MNGLECLSDIRDVSESQKIPVIIYANSFHKRDIGKLLNMNATQYLKKPSFFNQLKTLLLKALAKSKIHPIRVQDFVIPE